MERGIDGSPRSQPFSGTNRGSTGMNSTRQRTGRRAGWFKQCQTVPDRVQQRLVDSRILDVIQHLEDPPDLLVIGFQHSWAQRERLALAGFRRVNRHSPRPPDFDAYANPMPRSK